MKTKYLSSSRLLLIVCASLSFVTIQTARADDIAEKGRAIFKKNQLSVVTVQLVLKSRVSIPGRGGGDSNETRQDATGTVIDSSGLTVLSLSSTDPGGMLQSMMSSGDGESRLKVETELTDAKILLNDGTEIPAEVVLRDRDLDLAFLRPKSTPANPMTALDLAHAAKADVLDQVIALNRLGKAASRAYSASLERVSAVVQKPRLFYIPDANMTTTTLGCPAFTMDGKVLGVFVMRTTKARGGIGLGMFSQSESMTSIIVPADDIAKAAKQVPAAGATSDTKKDSAGEKAK